MKVIIIALIGAMAAPAAFGQAATANAVRSAVQGSRATRGARTGRQTLQRTKPTNRVQLKKSLKPQQAANVNAAPGGAKAVAPLAIATTAETAPEAVEMANTFNAVIADLTSGLRIQADRAYQKGLLRIDDAPDCINKLKSNQTALERFINITVEPTNVLDSPEFKGMSFVQLDRSGKTSISEVFLDSVGDKLGIEGDVCPTAANLVTECAYNPQLAMACGI